MLTVSGPAACAQHAHMLVASHLAGLHAHAMGYAHPRSPPSGGPAWAHTVAGCTYYAPPLQAPACAWQGHAAGTSGHGAHPPAGSWVAAESTIEASSSGEVSPGEGVVADPGVEAE